MSPGAECKRCVRSRVIHGMMPRILLLLLLPAGFVFARSVDQSSLPNAVRVPSTLQLLLEAHGVGDQIYTCKAAEGNYTWTLKAPDARLLGKDGQTLGRHFAGPTWQSNDGSKVVGKVAGSAASPDPDSVPWLRLDAVQHDGNGTMSDVIAIQRLNTKGGKAPKAGCDASHAGSETRVSYQADYYFYAKPK